MTSRQVPAIRCHVTKVTKNSIGPISCARTDFDVVSVMEQDKAADMKLAAETTTNDGISRSSQAPASTSM